MKLSSLMNVSIGILLALGLSALTWNELRFRSIEKSAQEQRLAVLSIVLLKDLRFHVVQIQQFLTDVSATHDEDGFADAQSHRDAALTTAAALAAGDPAYTAGAQKVAADINTLHEVGVNMAHAYERDGIAAGNALMKQSGDGFDDRSAALASSLEALESSVQARLQQADKNVARHMAWVRFSGIAVVLLLVGGMAGLMTTIRARMLPPLQRLHEGLEAMRKSHGAAVKIGDLGPDFDAVAQSFNAIIERLAESARQTQSRAEEICIGTQRLTSRASDQAARYEETAASMEEMTAAVKSNAQSAVEATRLASDARISAEQGTQVVGEVVGAIEQINRSSRSIGEIIGLIDEIAFQTNLLALNAAVEAARAGEQGRGFAVVAGEVRTLAGRSAEAAKQIKALIAQSVERVEQGSRLAAESGRSLASIVAAVDRVAAVISSINTASNEQAQEIDNVNRALVEIDGLTQENARMFSQAASAAEALIVELRGDSSAGSAAAERSTGAGPLARAA